MRVSIITCMLALSLMVANARVYEGDKATSTGRTSKIASRCLTPATSRDLDINNIRALIHTGGDMWWDLQQRAKYEVPKGSGKTALFAGSLWLGGVDVSNQLKVAAQRFRQGSGGGAGNVDFYTGPLRLDNAQTDGAMCSKFDKFFLTYKQEVSEFVAWNNAKKFDAENGTTTADANFPGYVVPQSIQDWPGNNEDPNYDFYLAPYVDVDGVEGYNWQGGDYPAYDIKGDTECRTDQLDQVYGDQNLWWVFNDNGDIHRESNGQPIGMEIRAQAFAFAANDEVNNMTFYNYKIINRSTFTLTNTYFGFWVDPDLGNYNDDYVGCDVEKGLGYCYNGDDYDESTAGALGYLDQPAAIGVDFFQGPFQDADGEDNAFGVGPGEAINGVGYGDGEVDNERFGMRRFLYHNNQNTVTATTDPSSATDYYNYLRGVWKDGNQMVYGGTGYPTGCGAPFSCRQSDFMFPGNSDPLGWGTGQIESEPWTEVTAGNVAADRRFIQSAGPFTLAPGASNYITVGVVWAQATSGGAQASLAALLNADRKTQAAFDNCFKILEGPFAPDLAFQELDRELILYIKNPVTSNNYKEQYSQKDPSNPAPDQIVTGTDPVTGNPIYYTLTDEEKEQWQTYYFQGYKIFQLKNKDVSITEIDNTNLARLVAQCDIKDGVSRIVNYEFDEALQLTIPRVKVEGRDNGIFHSLRITEDLFATENKTLVNHKELYYMAVAYAYNYSPYNEYDPNDPNKLGGQKLPYIQSGKAADGSSVKVFSAIPHKTDGKFDGTIINAQYGDGLEITRHEGRGNGGTFLRLTQESMDKIMSSTTWESSEITYEANAGPVLVKVIDPLNVPKGNFTLKLTEIDSLRNIEYNSANWELEFVGNILGKDTSIVFTSENTIDLGGEQLLLEVGLSIYFRQIDRIKDGAEDINLYQNAWIGAEIEFEDENTQWLGGVPDEDGTTTGTNWIRSGTTIVADDERLSDAKNQPSGAPDLQWADPKQTYESILGGTWAPFKLTAISPHGPAVFGPIPNAGTNMNNANMVNNRMEFLQSVDIVFTSDKSKWTRCPVIEMQEDNTVSVGAANKGHLRRSPSVDKNGVAFDTTGYGNLTSLPSSNNPDDPNFIGGYGMSWFPGYAIDVETGERLNIAFGEDSWLKAENGDDMIWNPTSKITEGPFNDTRLGGKHYIIVFRNNIVSDSRLDAFTTTSNINAQCPKYDHGEFLFKRLFEMETATVANIRARANQAVYSSGMWCSLPLVNPGFELLSLSEGLIPTKTTVRLRVATPYRAYVTGDFVSTNQPLPNTGYYFVERGPITYNGINYNRGSYFLGTAGETFTISLTANPNTADTTNNVRFTKNAARPYYTFNSDKYATIRGDIPTAQEALKLINVVPNPYYAYSAYESDRLDNRIKIINLPKTCEIKIYTTSGVLVRTLSKDDPNTTYLEWDLKNQARITVASGMYVIHVDAPGIGERVVKWFGMMRPIDLDAF